MTLGLAGPFARPARTLVTLAAIVFGVVAVTFAAGLGSSLDRVEADLSHAAAQPVQVSLPGTGPTGANRAERSGPEPRRRPLPSLAAQERAVQAALRAQPGTLRYVAEADDEISVPGLADRAVADRLRRRRQLDRVRADHRALVRRGPGQADVNTAFLTATGTAVGDTYTLTSGGRHVTVRIAGEVFDPAGGRPEIIAGLPTLAGLDPAWPWASTTWR